MLDLETDPKIIVYKRLKEVVGIVYIVLNISTHWKYSSLGVALLISLACSVMLRFWSSWNSTGDWTSSRVKQVWFTHVPLWSLQFFSPRWSMMPQAEMKQHTISGYIISCVKEISSHVLIFQIFISKV